MTRDRKELVCEWRGKRFLLIDTGGVDIADASPITRQIAEQARAAIGQADLVLFIVDAKAGITPGDEEIAEHPAPLTPAGARDREQDRPPRSRRGGARVPRARARRPRPHLGGARARHRRPARRGARAPSGTGPGRGRARGHPRGDPRPPERRQVVAPERVAGGEADDRLGAPRNDPRLDRHAARTGRHDVRPRRHRGPAAQAPPPPAARVLLGAAHDRGRRARGHRTRARRRLRGPRRPGRGRRGRRPQGQLGHARRACQVGRVADPDRGRAARGAPPAAPAAARDRRLRAYGARHRPAARQRGAALRQAHDAHLDPGAEQGARRPSQRAPAAGPRRKRLNLLYAAQVQTRPPRFRLWVNDPGLVTRDYAYWFENELRQRFGFEGAPVSIDFVRRS